MTDVRNTYRIDYVGNNTADQTTCAQRLDTVALSWDADVAVFHLNVGGSWHKLGTTDELTCAFDADGDGIADRMMTPAIDMDRGPILPFVAASPYAVFKHKPAKAASLDLRNIITDRDHYKVDLNGDGLGLTKAEAMTYDKNGTPDDFSDDITRIYYYRLEGPNW